MSQKLKFDYNWDSREIREVVKRGYQLTCPRCKADLEVALTPEEAREKKLRGGVFCPNNENHVAILIEFVEAHQNMRKLFAEMRAEREHKEKLQAK